MDYSLDTILPAKMEPFSRYSITCQNGTILQIPNNLSKWIILQIQYYQPKWNHSLDIVLPAKMEPFSRYNVTCQNGTLLLIKYNLPKWNPSLDIVFPAKMELFSRYSITCQNGLFSRYNPRGDAGGLSREYVLRVPSVS